MSALDYILDGLEQALELERELGVRSVECDRAVLTPAAEPFPRGVSRPPAPASGPAGGEPRTKGANPVAWPTAQTRSSAPTHARLPLVFLHDRPLSPDGVEMMAKIVTALGRTAENAPIVVVPPVPKAKVVVVLGGRAMKKHFPGMKGEPGQWIGLPTGEAVLVTYSPEYILRFGTVTPAVRKLKQDMWRSLKAVVQRI